MEVGLGELADLGANLPPVTWGEREAPRQGEGGLNAEKKQAAAPGDIAALNERLLTAYSTDKYGDTWVPCIKALRRRGYDDRQVEAIIRSKWTRWAAERAYDRHGRRQGRATSADLLAFMDQQHPDRARQRREVEELTAETAATLGWDEKATPATGEEATAAKGPLQESVNKG
jgi:hypothetical protein